MVDDIDRDFEEYSNDEEMNFSDEPGGSDGDDVRDRKIVREKNRAIRAEQEAKELLEIKERELQALRSAPPATVQETPSEIYYTETQIHQMYSDGKLTADQAEKELSRNETRKERELEDKVVKRVTEVTKGQEMLTDMRGELDAYIKAIPSLNDKTSDEYDEVKSEYQKLIGMGSPDNTVTELLAIKSIFGSLDRVKGKSNQNIDQYDRDNRDTSMETSGGSRPSDRNSGSGGGNESLLKRVDPETRQYWDYRGFTKERQMKLASQIEPRKLVG